MNISAAHTNELKNCLASSISEAKAYNVPSICSRLGLLDGDTSEAFSSKFQYVRKRLDLIDQQQIMSAAQIYLSEFEEDYNLSEAVAKISELGTKTITEITRKRIIDALGKDEICDEIQPLDFLRRVWPIEKMASRYERNFEYNNLEGDIHRHYVINGDWDVRELLEVLGLMTCSQKQVFNFIEQITHPMVQSETRAQKLVHALNTVIDRDGFKLTSKSEISGCPVYKVCSKQTGAPSDQSIGLVLESFDPETIHLRWEKALERRSSDIENAITLARTLLEDVCKWILHQAGDKWQENDDLVELYKKTASHLKLAPDDHTEKIFKQILGGCSSVVYGLGSLRNKLSDSHSVGPLRVKAAARHAELAVNLSGTMATFLVETWKTRRVEQLANSGIS